MVKDRRYVTDSVKDEEGNIMMDSEGINEV